ncbi:MAG: hypothetical protein JSS66_15985 [Armatimonadetes bacterium]|nr:hypothetical protein [Armatimonadota bacterium]
MSLGCSHRQFEKHYRDYLSLYALADIWQRSEASKSFVKSLSRMAYFNMRRAEVSIRNHPMVDVIGVVSMAKRLPEHVQQDFIKVWREASGRSSRAFHAISMTDEGFLAEFMALYGSYIVTYRLVVIAERTSFSDEIEEIYIKT